MRHFRMTICLLVALCLVCGNFVMPAAAGDDPMAVKDFDQFGAAQEAAQSAEPQPEETKPEETLPEERLPAEIPPEEILPEESQLAEILPEETLPEETKPEEMPVEGTTLEKILPEETIPKEAAAETAAGNFPQYFQTDYPDIRFGTGTVANNGCSVTSLAMVATYMTGHVYSPAELARYFGGRAENNIARLEMGSEALRLPYKKAENWLETYAALEAGKLAIVLVDNRTPFTQSQHFLILTELNEAGKIVVYDSYEPNYSKWELKQGFAEGFAPGIILQGYSGGWIYDVDAMPEKPYIYSEPQPDHSQTRYPGIRLTLEQEDLLAKVIWAEARGESAEGQQAVAEVVLNRLKSDRFPNTLYDVIHGEGQFRTVPFLKDAEPSQAQYEAIEKALYGPNILPEDVYYFATFPTTEKVWGEIGGHIFCYAENA